MRFSFPNCISPFLAVALTLASSAVATAAAAPAPAELAASGTAEESFAFDRYGRDVGLTGVVVNLALQTKDGYLWLATPPGLRRFDGVRFQTFRAETTPGLPSDSVQCLLEDREAALWIGTARGAVRYRDGRFEPIGSHELNVRALATNRAGDVWVGTAQNGLYLWRAGRLEPVVQELLTAGSAIRALFCDAVDRLWIALDGGAGVLCLDRGVLRAEGVASPELLAVLTITEQPRGTLWFGTQHHGLFRWRDGALAQFRLRETGAHIAITDVRPEQNGGLWISAGPLWLARAGETFAATQVSDLPTESVRSVLEDREGGVWVCSGAAGLLRMRPMTYRSLTAADGLPSNNVKTVAVDGAGNVWLGVQQEGILQVSPSGSVRRQAEPEGLPVTDPAVVYATRDGTVWAAIDSWLYAWRSGKWQTYLNFRYVRGFFEDRRGVRWVATRSDGLFRVEHDVPIEVRSPVGEPILRATAFCEAPDGAVFIGTRSNGIYRFDAGKVTALDEAHGLPSNEIRAVYADRDAHLWVGMRARGLALLDGERWFNSDALAAAVSHHVLAIFADDSDRLWLGTSAGVVWVARRELLAAIRAGGPLPRLHTVVSSSDVADAPVSSGSQPVMWPTADGMLWFATRQGAIAINLRHVVTNPVPPPVHIERVLVDRQVVDHTAGVQLPAGTRTLSLEYTAPSFVEPDRVRFKYRLIGYESEWVDAENHRVASYSRLPPGRYTFRVIASNNDGVWNTAGRELAIVQQPYFYQTRGFQALMVVAGLGAAWGIYRWSHRRLRLRLERLEREHAMENERRRIAQDLHDDLGANLTEIGLFAQTSAPKTPEEARREMDFLADRTRNLVRSLDAAVWAVNPANDSLDELGGYMGEFFQELFSRSAIRARLEVTPCLPRYPLTAEERSNLFLAAKEAMNNVLKHSGASEAWLRITITGDEFAIIVEDNGHGFVLNSPEAGNGNGLTNMRNRIEKSGGQITFKSEVGKGSAVRITMRFSGRSELPKREK